MKVSGRRKTAMGIAAAAFLFHMTTLNYKQTYWIEMLKHLFLNLNTGNGSSYVAHKLLCFLCCAYVKFQMFQMTWNML